MGQVADAIFKSTALQQGATSQVGQALKQVSDVREGRADRQQRAGFQEQNLAQREQQLEDTTRRTDIAEFSAKTAQLREDRIFAQSLSKARTAADQGKIKESAFLYANTLSNIFGGPDEVPKEFNTLNTDLTKYGGLHPEAYAKESRLYVRSVGALKTNLDEEGTEYEKNAVFDEFRDVLSNFRLDSPFLRLMKQMIELGERDKLFKWFDKNLLKDVEAGKALKQVYGSGD